MTTEPEQACGEDAAAVEVEDHGCCALVEGHDGCCVYVCSMCNGRGRGCECGFCDGTGYCQECSGHGYFNEFGEPCFPPSPEEFAAYGTCDWGGCDQPAERFRLSDEVDAWLPVCAEHRDIEAPSSSGGCAAEPSA